MGVLPSVGAVEGGVGLASGGGVGGGWVVVPPVLVEPGGGVGDQGFDGPVAPGGIGGDPGGGYFGFGAAGECFGEGFSCGAFADFADGEPPEVLEGWVRIIRGRAFAIVDRATV
jgi:hypothetical protein